MSRKVKFARMVNNNTYLIPSGSGLSKYLDDVKKFPMLSLEKYQIKQELTEKSLSKNIRALNWKKHG